MTHEEMKKLVLDVLRTGRDAPTLVAIMNRAMISDGLGDRITNLGEVDRLSPAATAAVLKALAHCSYRSPVDTARAAALARKAS